MRVLRGDPMGWNSSFDHGSAVTIGVYDGIHLGHQQLLSEVRSLGLPVVVITFDPHPLSVVDPKRVPMLLTSVNQRIEILDGLGIDTVAVVAFESVRAWEPDRFVDDVLVGSFAAKAVTVGVDFRFGRSRAGSVETLKRAGRDRGFEVLAVPLITEVDGRPVSSTAIRGAVAAGDMVGAAGALGRNFVLEGQVVRGVGRGRTIGVPTANLEVASGMAVPGKGVYAVRVGVAEEWMSGVANVGSRPTFGGGPTVVEVHILDFEADLYGQRLNVEFVDRIREERRFEGVDELVAQIERDMASARLILGV